MEEDLNQELQDSVEEEVVEEAEVENDDSENVEETETPETNEEVEDLKTRLADLEAKNAQLYQRVKKTPQKKTPNKLSDTIPDEVFLVADGTINKEDLAVLRRLQAGDKAQGEDRSMIDLLKDPVYIASKEKRENEAKSKNAALGASAKGTQSATPEYVENQPREDHKKLWEKTMKG